MEIASSSSHMSGGRGGGDDDGNNNNNRGKKPLLQQQKENQPSKVKKTKGRRKIQIRRIMTEQARLSTFSKRRSGIYKKVNDIATQCGCHVGVVGITLAGRTFAFGNPNIETIIQRFLEEHQAQHVPEKEGIDRLVEAIVEAHRRVRVDLLNINHDIVREQIEEETLKSESLNHVNRAFTNGNPNPHWLDLDNEDEMSYAQMEAAAQDLQNAIRVANEFSQIVLQQHNVMPPPPPLPLPQPPVVEYYEGGSSGQPLQDAAQWTMMDTVMEDPSSSSSAPVAPATDNLDEEILDEEELMFLRFFGDYPSSPPGPF